MDQEKDAGHPLITKEAVHELFASGRADANGEIEGLTEDQFYEKLNADQAFMDRWYGPTIRPAWMDGADQREHAMADPKLSGEQNLERDRAWIQDNMAEAHADGSLSGNADAMSHLGAAAHALEDSYSEAHEFRGDAEHSGNPDAPIESFNVFDPTGLSGGGGVIGGLFSSNTSEGTHDERFDKVPLDSEGHMILGDDRAAVSATAQMLESFVDQQNASQSDASSAFDNTVGNFFQTDGSAPGVNTDVTDAWKEERDRRLAIDNAQIADAGGAVAPSQLVAEGITPGAADYTRSPSPSPSPSPSTPSTPSPSIPSPTPTFSPSPTPSTTPSPSSSW